ncbi:MAG: hypothetical protein Q7T05_05310 [Dehalococcoidia bacterium]|nr:hypothetical protein [Dehalococcoidia bacterium]
MISNEFEIGLPSWLEEHLVSVGHVQRHSCIRGLQLPSSIYEQLVVTRLFCRAFQ